MMIEITKVTCSNEAIEIEGNDIEAMFLVDDIFEDYEAPTVRFAFDPKNQGHLKYLYKLAASQSKSKFQKSLGKKIEALAGAITQINTAFQVAA